MRTLDVGADGWSRRVADLAARSCLSAADDGISPRRSSRSPGTVCLRTSDKEQKAGELGPTKMFCAKLKELKISGECPFSSSAKSSQLERSEQPSADAAHFLPTSKDVHRKTGEDAPHQKSSRAKVNLHTLGESIRKLACPEVRKNSHLRRDFMETVRICVVRRCHFANVFILERVARR